MFLHDIYYGYINENGAIRFYNNFFVYELLLIFLILIIFGGIWFENRNVGERRILFLFISFELIHILLIILLVFGAIFDRKNVDLFLTFILLIIVTSGAETGLFLSFFIRYFKLTGLTSFIISRKKIILSPFRKKTVLFHKNIFRSNQK